jgi:hypothetical protein
MDPATLEQRKSGFTEKFSARVEVTGDFPFLVTKLLPYLDA